MMKTFTKQRFAALAASLMMCLVASAQVVDFNFGSNPMNFPTAKRGDKPEVGSLHQEGGVEYKGVRLISKKGNARYFNRIENGVFKIYGDNTITLKAPEGKIIKSIESQLKQDDTFFLEAADKAIITRESSKLRRVEWDNGVSEMSFSGGKWTTPVEGITVFLEDVVPAGIEQVEAVGAVNAKVYSLEGIVVGTQENFNQLPAGIYVIDGKKVMKH